MCRTKKEQETIWKEYVFQQENIQRRLRSDSADCREMVEWYKNPYNKDVTRVRDINFDGESQ